MSQIERSNSWLLKLDKTKTRWNISVTGKKTIYKAVIKIKTIIKHRINNETVVRVSKWNLWERRSFWKPISLLFLFLRVLFSCFHLFKFINLFAFFYFWISDFFSFFYFCCRFSLYIHFFSLLLFLFYFHFFWRISHGTEEKQKFLSKYYLGNPEEGNPGKRNQKFKSKKMQINWIDENMKIKHVGIERELK